MTHLQQSCFTASSLLLKEKKCLLAGGPKFARISSMTLNVIRLLMCLNYFDGHHIDTFAQMYLCLAFVRRTSVTMQVDPIVQWHNDGVIADGSFCEARHFLQSMHSVSNFWTTIETLGYRQNFTLVHNDYVSIFKTEAENAWMQLLMYNVWPMNELRHFLTVTNNLITHDTSCMRSGY